MATLILLAYGLAFPLPCLALLATLRQRQQHVYEKARLAQLHRVARGGRR